MTSAACKVEILSEDESASERIQRAPLPDVVIVNIRATERAVASIARLRRARPHLRIIALLPHGGDPNLDALDIEANISVWRPCDDETLNALIERCLSEGSGRSELEQASERAADVEELGHGRFFVMASPAMRRLREQVDQVARTDVPALMLGEGGTGKEVIARLIHSLSPRSHRPFVKVNCAAMPSELLVIELFGYERGAFTGAVQSRPGLLESSKSGTLFLDKVAATPSALQAKLLHFLQDREFSRLGSCSRIKVNVRILAATNANINAAVSGKTFSEDIYYRLSRFVFSVPPLREHIRVLFRRFTSHHADALGLPPRLISKSVWDLCMTYHWPGNIRELQNLAKRYIICGEEGLGLSALHPQVEGCGQGAGPAVADSRGGDLKSEVREVRNRAEALAIARALEETHWNRREAAKMLKINYKLLLSKIQRYGLVQASSGLVGEYKINSSGSASGQ